MEYIHEHLIDKIFVGIVEDNSDPLRLGRIKIRVQSLYDDLETDAIPWASPYVMSVSGKAFNIPQIGKIVSVIFVNDILYEPYYINSDHFNINLQKKLESYDIDEYKAFIALLFDHKTQIFSDNESLTLDYKYNKVKITNSGIDIDLKDNNQKINLGGNNTTQQAIFGNHWLEWFDKLVNALLKPTSLIDSTAKSILKPEIDTILREYNDIRNTFISKNIYMVDNNEIKNGYRTPNVTAIEHDSIRINKDVSDFEDDYKKKITEEYNRNNDELKSTIPTNIIEVEGDYNPAIDTNGSGSFVVDNIKKSRTELSDIRVIFSGETISDDEQIVTGNMIIDENGNKKYLTDEEYNDIRKLENDSYGIPNNIDYSIEDLLVGENSYKQNISYNDYDLVDIEYIPVTEKEFSIFLENLNRDSNGNVYVTTDQGNMGVTPHIRNFTFSNIEGYIFPIDNIMENIILSSTYGPRIIRESNGEFHAGLDFEYKLKNVVAIQDGVVITCKKDYSRPSGAYVRIEHQDGIVSEYMHLDRILIKNKQKVFKGDIIGISGASGEGIRIKYGYHLHFSTYKILGNKKTYFNPIELYLNKTFLYKGGRNLGILKNNTVYTGNEIVNGWKPGTYNFQNLNKFHSDLKSGKVTRI